MSIVWSILGFALLIGVLVTIHEWGHYAVARLFNVKVLQFSVGFGKPLYKLQRGETEYRLGMIPLGGYVKFLDERVEPVAENEKARAFNQQSVYKRFAIVLAGPMINLLFAWLLFALISMIGTQTLKPIFDHPVDRSPLAQAFEGITDNQQAWWLQQVNGQTVTGWHQVQQAVLQALVHDQSHIELGLAEFDYEQTSLVRLNLALDQLDINNVKTSWLSELGFKPKMPAIAPILGQLSPGAAAELAGLQSGDRVLTMNGESILDWQTLVLWVRAHPNQQVRVSFERDQATYYADLTLGSATEQGEQIGRLGASVAPQAVMDERYYQTQRYGLFGAVAQGWQQSVNLIHMTLAMFKKMLFGEVGLAHLSGPLSIADFSGQALQTGLISFLGLMALLSLSLGILNLLPIPMLDGGHLMFYLFEMVRGKPVNEKVEEVGYRIGLMLIIGLTLLAFTNDLVRITNG